MSGTLSRGVRCLSSVLPPHRHDNPRSGRRRCPEWAMVLAPAWGLAGGSQGTGERRQGRDIESCWFLSQEFIEHAANFFLEKLRASYQSEPEHHLTCLMHAHLHRPSSELICLGHQRGGEDFFLSGQHRLFPRVEPPRLGKISLACGRLSLGPGCLWMGDGAWLTASVDPGRRQPERQDYR